jgi:molybdate transport system substrate-binding protein
MSIYLKNLLLKNMRWMLIGCVIIAGLSGVSQAGQLHVAVASNFLLPLRSMSEDFEKQTGNTLHISSGSTGKLYAQIVNGAPFDVFLAANSREPKRLEDAGMVVRGSRFTYALGQLALWGPAYNASTIDFEAALTLPTVQRISVANPQTAPYGAAAIETLKKLGIYGSLKAKIINGENVSQAYQYVASGAAQLGFVALSQIKAQKKTGNDAGKHYWLVDKSVYPPIQQQAVLVKGAENNSAAQQFIAYLKSPQGRTAIKAFGYSIEGQ